MRPLRVLGLAEGEQGGVGQTLVCEDPTTGEQFSIPCDDRLRAGARGDLSRFGQLEIELESQLRPKEIQARIRAGATVEQVASIAGTSALRVERFAYPVLLERASVAEKAIKARARSHRRHHRRCVGGRDRRGHPLRLAAATAT